MLISTLVKNRIAKNIGWILGAKCVQSLLAFMINMFTARFLGPSNYGIINYAASLTSFVTPIMNLGITSILVNELIRHKDREGEILGTAVFLNLIASFFCALGMISFCIVANPNDNLTVIVCALYSILLPFMALKEISAWFNAHLLSKYSATVAIIAYFAVSVYKILLLITGKSVKWFAVSNALDVALIAMILYIIYWKLGGQKLCIRRQTAKRLISRGKYYIISNMMVAIFAQTDRIMLKSMMSSEAVGYYSAASSCALVTSVVVSAIIDSFRPVIFSSKDNPRKYEANLKVLYGIVIYISLAQSLMMTLFARLLIRILYGTAFIPAVTCLQLLVWFTTFSYLGSVRNIWILSEEKQKYLWIINLSGAGANVLCNAILIPVWGILGAATASLVTQFFSNVIVGYLIPAIRPSNWYIIAALNPKGVLDDLRFLSKPMQKGD